MLRLSSRGLRERNDNVAMGEFEDKGPGSAIDTDAKMGRGVNEVDVNDGEEMHAHSSDDSRKTGVNQRRSS